MSRRMRRPDTVKIDISRGDWILVKKHLTAGETRAIFAQMLGPDQQINRLNVGVSKVAGYLLDWSFTDADDQPIRIKDQSDDVLRSILNNLDADTFLELTAAIDAHEAAMAQEREREKNGPDGAIGSSAISPSVV